jgi:glycine cleavage system transcriptional repressor
MNYCLLTVQGPNRAGMVADISGLLHEQRVNLMDSSMTTLRSEFVMMMLLALPPELSAEQLQTGFAPLEQQGLRLYLQALSEAEAFLPVTPPAPSHAISVIGPDQTGIVYQVSAVLAARSINILGVDTQLLERGPEPVYAMVIELDARQANLAELQQALADVSQTMGLDLHLHPIHFAEI